MKAFVRAAALPRDVVRALRFGSVGVSGIGANLAALHVFAQVLGLPDAASSALAIEVSIVWNFLLHDAFTFRDRRATARVGFVGRLARYHAVSLVGGLVQLGVFVLAAYGLSRATGRAEIGGLRYAAQALGIAVAFAWTFAGSSRFAWASRTLGGRAGGTRTAGLALATGAFAALVVVHLVPIWIVHYFPTQDGPLHVENVLALLQHGRSPLLQRWYAPNWGAQPNWLTQALLAGLLQVAPPLLAEKLVLSAYTILFALSFRAVLPRGTQGWWAALAAFPFVHAYPFHMGFWNFVYGFALALLAVGYWSRRRGRLRPGGFVVLAVLGVLLFLAHSVAFAGAALAIGILLAWRAGLSLSRARANASRRRKVLRGWSSRAAAAALAGSPGLVLVLAWVVAHRDRTAMRIPFPELAAKLVTGYALVSIDRREIVLAACVMLAMFVGLVHLWLARASSARRLRPHDGWLVAAAVFALLYFAVPDVVAAGAHVSDRFALFALVSVAAWIGAGASAPASSQRRIAGALAAVAVVALGVRLEKQRELSAYVAEFVSAGNVVPEGSVLLPLAMSPNGPRDRDGRRLGYRIKPFLHATGWIVATRGGVDLKNSQANTDHCPVRFAPERNPFRTIAASLGRMEGSPPCVDLRSPAIASVDYVLLWGATREALETPCGAALAAELAARYDPVFLSQPSGMLEVWRPRVTAAGR